MLISSLLFSEVFVSLLLNSLLENHIAWGDTVATGEALGSLPVVVADLDGTGLAWAQDHSLVCVLLNPIPPLYKQALARRLHSFV